MVEGGRVLVVVDWTGVKHREHYSSLCYKKGRDGGQSVHNESVLVLVLAHALSPVNLDAWNAGKGSRLAGR